MKLAFAIALPLLTTPACYGQEPKFDEQHEACSAGIDFLRKANIEPSRPGPVPIYSCIGFEKAGLDGSVCIGPEVAVEVKLRRVGTKWQGVSAKPTEKCKEATIKFNSIPARP